MNSKITILLLIAISIYACQSATRGDKKNTNEGNKRTREVINEGPGMTSEYSDGAGFIAADDCFTCHRIDSMYVGPSYMAVARKYDNSSANVYSLARHIINGSSGVWGDAKMIPHPTLSLDSAREMVRYILSLRNSAQKQP